MTIKLEEYIRQHPMFGVLFSYATALFSLFAEATPLFAAISAVLGAIVIFYTLRIKLIEYEIKKAELLERKKKDLEL
jgi:hypothetical protein